ncbi:MAG: hypothetical protein ACO1QB_13670 [Verrucomicrobiales bacterium]
MRQGQQQSPKLPKLKKEILGKMCMVLLPLEKLKKKSSRGIAFEQEIHDYLVITFNGYTVASGNISGYWKDESGHEFYGEHREYKVAIPSHTARETLELFLATLADEMNEECVYFEFGEETWLIYRHQV